MQNKHLFIAILLCAISTNIWSMDVSIKLKYSNALLTEDYNILNEKDLAAYTREIKLPPFSPNKFSDYNYWQCFPREDISITLEAKGYSSEDIGWKENYADLKIIAWSGKNISHEYSMRRPWTVSSEEKIFNDWQKLMKNEKYVCLAGHFGRREEVVQNGIKHQIYSWTFEKIKTKKGCDSYFMHQC